MHTAGIVLYIVAMWISGVMQGLMWRAVNTDGTLTYSFVESLTSFLPVLLHAFLRWCISCSRFVLMAYNMFKTIAAKDGSLS